jgi:hypothetical protein
MRFCGHCTRPESPLANTCTPTRACETHFLYPHRQVVYKMPSMFMLREPLLLVSAFFVMFFGYITLSRVDLTLSAEKKSV